MKWLVLATLLAAPAYAAEIETNKPFDDLWRASVQALVLKGVELDVNDKNGGIITAHFKDPPRDTPYFECDRGQGKRWEVHTEITIRIRGAADQAHRVEVIAKAYEKWVRSKKIAFIRLKHIWTDVPCHSTGQFEQLVLQEISKNLE